MRAEQTIGGAKVDRLRAGETDFGLCDACAKNAPAVPHHTFEIAGPSDPQQLIRDPKIKVIKTHAMRLHGNGPGYSV